MKALYIIGGPPGSGKSTTAGVIAEGYYPTKRVEHYEADMFFMNNGEYRFDILLTPQAHEWCRVSVSNAMLDNCPIIIVSNTFTLACQRQPYIDLAKLHGYTITYIHCGGRFQNVHDVPKEVVDQMIEEYEPYLP
jgi:predicted ABC-type ATPase